MNVQVFLDWFITLFGQFGHIWVAKCSAMIKSVGYCHMNIDLFIFFPSEETNQRGPDLVFYLLVYNRLKTNVHNQRKDRITKKKCPLMVQRCSNFLYARWVVWFLVGLLLLWSLFRSLLCRSDFFLLEKVKFVTTHERPFSEFTNAVKACSFNWEYISKLIKKWTC